MFVAHLSDALRVLQYMLTLYEARTLDEETYSLYMSFIAALFATPGGHRFWQQQKHLYAGRIAQALEDRLAKGQLPDIHFMMDSNADKANEDTPPVAVASGLNH